MCEIGIQYIYPVAAFTDGRRQKDELNDIADQYDDKIFFCINVSETHASGWIELRFLMESKNWWKAFPIKQRRDVLPDCW